MPQREIGFAWLPQDCGPDDEQTRMQELRYLVFGAGVILPGRGVTQAGLRGLEFLKP